MSAHLTLIALKKIITVKLNALLDKLQKNKIFSFNYVEEVYWKDDQKVKIDMTIDCVLPLPASVWMGLFDVFSEHVSTFKDDNFMEFALFSDLSNEDDLFAILYVPLIMIK